MSTAGERKRTRRNEILAAAQKVFSAKGYYESGIADIAAELGIGHGTFYRYFKNKHDIATAVLDQVIERLASVGLSEDPRASNTLAEYRAQTARILTGMIDLAFSHPNVLRFFQTQSLAIDPERLGKTMDRFSEHTERFLGNGIDKGFLRADLDVQTTAQALVSLIFEGARRGLLGGDDALRRRWIEGGMRLMFDGIKAAE